MKNLICRIRGHSWSGWEYITPDECTQIKTCTRCDESETKLQHENYEWEYEDPISCSMICKCTRCEELRKYNGQEFKHLWEEWKTADNHEYQRKCDRCGNEEVEIRHTWEILVDNGCTGKHKCKICEKEENYDNHSWESYEEETDSDVSGGEHCTRCGETQNTWGAFKYP